MMKQTTIQHLVMMLFAYSACTQADEITNTRGVRIKPVEQKLILADESTNAKGVTVQNIAGDDMIIIDGDNMDMQIDRKLHASGNASITRGKQVIYGDDINYDMQNDALHVKGNAKIQLGNGELTGPEIKMRLSDNVGEINNASVKLTKAKPAPQSRLSPSTSEQFARKLGTLQSQQIGGYSSHTLEPNYTEKAQDVGNGDASSTFRSLQTTSARGDAEQILFEGQDKKRLKNARYTTCEVGNNDWYIKAKEMELNDFSESGEAKSAYIEFKGVPLVYTPWISFSYNNQRKSGFLAPTYGTTSRSGFELLAPYYWNISPDMDATLGVRALSKRGVQYQGEFRYLNESFSGIANAEFLPDDSQTGENRYFASFKHQHNLGRGWSAGYSIERVSDDQYFSDLSTRIVTTSRVLLPQQFNVNYGDDVWRFNALTQKFQTLDDASFPYERLPELNLVGNKYFGNLNTNLYTQAVSFQSSNPNTVQTEGERFTIYPSVSYEFTKSYGFITPKIGVHHTQYQLNNIASNLDSPHRTLPIFSLDSGLYFDRDISFSGESFTQTIEPRAYYLYIPRKNQSDIPIFDTSETDLNFTSLFAENQFAGNDRINDARLLSFGLTTRFIDSDGAQRISASLGQRYYYADQVVTLPGQSTRERNSSDIIAGFTAYLKSDFSINAFWQYNTEEDKSARTTITSRYTPEPGKALNLSYSYRENLLDQFDVSGQWPLGKSWYGISRINYSFRDSRIIESLAGLEYDAGCWQARGVMQRVSPATSDDANYSLFFQLELGGLASIGANPMNVIKRNIPGYVSSSRIPDSSQQPYYE
jgi:LPS-assembly protein